MSENIPTRPNESVESLLFDIEETVRKIEIPHLIHEESEPFEPATFTELQTRAWWMYLRSMISEHTGDTSLHLSEAEAIKWLDHQLRDDQDGALTERMVPRKYIPAKTLAKVEKVLPGSAQVYLMGPDFSWLWKALAGTDEGQAMKRFSLLSGLSEREICEIEPDFLEALMDCFEPIALHALAAMVSALRRSLSCTSSSFPEHLMALLQMQGYDVKGGNGQKYDVTSCEIAANPWLKRMLACLHHNATIGRLSLYGLARLDLFGVCGKPTTTVANGHGFKFYIGANMDATIRFPRGEIPRNQTGKWMPEIFEDDPDTVTLAVFARYWHEKRL